MPFRYWFSTFTLRYFWLMSWSSSDRYFFPRDQLNCVFDFLQLVFCTMAEKYFWLDSYDRKTNNATVDRPSEFSTSSWERNWIIKSKKVPFFSINCRYPPASITLPFFIIMMRSACGRWVMPCVTSTRVCEGGDIFNKMHWKGLFSSFQEPADLAIQ